MRGFRDCLSVLVLVSCVQLQLFVLAHEGHDHHSEDGHSASNWTHWADLKKRVGVDFKWSATDSTYVTMEMSSRTEGYVAVGFCPVWTSSMAGCDIVVGWVDNAGVGHLVDYHATGDLHPLVDVQQDYILISAKQENWLTKITFKRKWDTGDVGNDANLERDKVQIIWSWNPEDVIGNNMKPHDKNTRGHTTEMISLKTPPKQSELSTTTTTTTATTGATTGAATTGSTGTVTVQTTPVAVAETTPTTTSITGTSEHSHSHHKLPSSPSTSTLSGDASTTTSLYSHFSSTTFALPFIFVLMSILKHL